MTKWIVLLLASAMDFQRNLPGILSQNLLNLETFPKHMFIVSYFELFQEWIPLTGVLASCLSPLQSILISLLSYFPESQLQSSHFPAGTVLMAPYWMPNNVQIHHHICKVMSLVAIPLLNPISPKLWFVKHLSHMGF